jgi:hypothetical protein
MEENPMTDDIKSSPAKLYALLVKYIDHVGNEEGVVFIPDVGTTWPAHPFTPEELELLNEASSEDL